MGKTTGFLEFDRAGPAYRPVPIRLRDWREVYEPQDDGAIAHQAARCMDLHAGLSARKSDTGV
jgi:glutamate synthase (NADPH/NADH) small chain